MFNVIYMTLCSQTTTISEKNSFMAPFYFARTFARIRQHYFSKYWGGDGCMGRPPPQIFWGPSPLGPCPCIEVLILLIQQEMSQSLKRTCTFTFYYKGSVRKQKIT